MHYGYDVLWTHNGYDVTRTRFGDTHIGTRVREREQGTVREKEREWKKEREVKDKWYEWIHERLMKTCHWLPCSQNPSAAMIRVYLTTRYRSIYSPFASLITNYHEDLWYWSRRSGLLACSLPTRLPFSLADFFSFSRENGVAGHLNRGSTTFACTILARNLFKLSKTNRVK